MESSVNDIAKLVNGKVSGNGSAVVRGAAGLDDATPSDISFLRDEKKKDAVAKSKAAAVFVPKGFQSNGKTLIEVESPIEAFATVLSKISLEKTPIRTGVHPQAVIASTAKIGKNVFIGPFCIIEDDAQIGDGSCLLGHVYVGARSSIGAGTKIYPQVVLREDVKIGSRCILHAGAVIGSDGFGFFFAKGKHNKIPQIGTVIVEDDVEVGSCTTIDRATTGATVIGQGTKIDNLAQVAHNVQIGPLSLLAAQVGIAGSSKIGKGVAFGGQAGVADHITIGDGAQIGGQTGIIQNISPGAVLFGTPAQPIKEALEQAILLKRLPTLFSDVKKLKGKQHVGDKPENA